MPSKSKKKPAKQVKTFKVSASPPKPPSKPTTGTGKSSASANKTLLPSVFAAIVAFLGGVLTPPSLHAFGANQSSPVASLPFPLPPSVRCTSSNLNNYLHDTPVTGLHVVCVEQIYLAVGKEHPMPETSDMNERQRRLDQADLLRLTFYKGAHPGSLLSRVEVKGSGSGAHSISWGEVKMSLIAELGLAQEGPTQQPWAAFTALGERIVGENDVIVKEADLIGSNNYIMNTIAASGVIVVVQGGKWVWPGVREGFKRNVDLSRPNKEETSNGPHNITIETLSLKPLVLSAEGFLSDEECDHIANKAGPSMKYSSVTLKDIDKGKASTEWRTSQSAFLSAQDDPILKDIEFRTARLTRVPRNHQEYVQVLRYGASEKYDAHHDYFDPKAYMSDKNTLKLIENGKKNRFATVFWYLSDVDDGGHTVFPRAGGLPPIRDHSDCSRGLKVQPQKGKVIIFYSLDASGAMDPYSLHGACPVGKNSVKWAANKWVWNSPVGYIDG